MARPDDYNKQQAQRSFLRRIWVIAFLVLVFLGLLFTRFIWLQYVHYEKYSQRATTNRTDVSPISPIRGAIIDRNGVVLAYNASTYTVEITPTKVSDLDATIAAIAAIVPVSERDIRRFKQALGNTRRRFDSVPLTSNLSETQVAVLSAQLFRLPGVEVNSRFIRSYPLGSTGSHVIGYMGGITDNDIARLNDSDEIDNYRGTKEIGRAGIEASYEQALHGTTGVAEVEKTAGGRPVRRLREIGAKPGNLIQLTLDARLQRLVEELYGKRRGAFVAIDPRNGEILALVSMPTFNPNQFIEGFDQESWGALNDAVDQPLFHRAIGGTYPIGSTYKPFMALAGMQTGTRTANQVIVDPGFFRLGNNRPWRSTGGSYNAERAIIKSNNYYFYSLAYEMGINQIHDFMKPWGFGQLTGIDLGGEVRGILPSTQWKQSAYKKPSEARWYDGETVNVGIGQGHNRFTILQLASALATLVNQGNQNTPHLLAENKNVMTGEVRPYLANTPQEMGVRPEYLQVVLEAMRQVPLQGTSRYAYAGTVYASGGKTGTAQVASVPQGVRYNAALLEEFQRDHSLYISFAPVEDPRIVIAVIVENAGTGATSAAPIARRAMDYYLQGQYPSEADMIATQNGYAGPPRGGGRLMMDYDIIPAELLIPLSAVEINATGVNTWEQNPPDLEVVEGGAQP